MAEKDESWIIEDFGVEEVAKGIYSNDDEYLLGIESTIGYIDNYTILIHSKEIEHKDHKPHAHIMIDRVSAAKILLPPENSTKLDGNNIVLERDKIFHGAINLNSKLRKTISVWFMKKWYDEIADENKNNLKRAWIEWRRVMKDKNIPNSQKKKKGGNK